MTRWAGLSRLGNYEIKSFMARFDIRQMRYIEIAKNILQSIVPVRALEFLPVRLLRSWGFQGALYLDWREFVYRWAVEIFIFLVSYSALKYILDWKLNLLFSFINVHTLMWLFNGHVWA